MIGFTGILLGQFQLHTIERIRFQYIPRLNHEISSRMMLAAWEVNSIVQSATQDFLLRSNQTMDDLEVNFNNVTMEPLQVFNRNFNSSLNKALDDALFFWRDTLKLQVFMPILDRLIDCFIRRNVIGIANIVESVASFRLNLPRLDENLLQFNLEHLNTTMKREQVNLLGGFVRNKTSGDVIYRRGRTEYVIDYWEGRVQHQMTFSTWTFVFGIIIVIQGLFGLAWSWIKYGCPNDNDNALQASSS